MKPIGVEEEVVERLRNAKRSPRTTLTLAHFVQ